MTISRVVNPVLLPILSIASIENEAEFERILDHRFIPPELLSQGL